MTAQLPELTLHIEGMVDFRNAQGITTRIQAAMQNGLRHIELVLTPSAIIASAELLAFLAAAARYLQSAGGGITIRGATGKNRSLLTISRIETLVTVE